MTELEQSADTPQPGFKANHRKGTRSPELLADVTAGQARRRVVPNADSIWELVLHIDVWHRVVQTTDGPKDV